MRFFFYGTLMDEALLARVLRRRVSARSLCRATLYGYRRTGVKERLYPMVLPSPGGKVRGCALDRANARDCRLLSAYEGEEYRLARAQVSLAGGAKRRVLLFVPKAAALIATNRPWSFARWRAKARVRALPRIPAPGGLKTGTAHHIMDMI